MPSFGTHFVSGLLSLAALSLAGCATMRYDKLQFGVALPANAGDPGATHVFADSDFEATLLRSTTERQLIWKIWLWDETVRDGARKPGGLQDASAPSVFARASRFRLRGELDPVLYGATGADLPAALRLLADELSRTPDIGALREFPRRAAAGLVRILQRWPGPLDEGPAYPMVLDLLDRVPAGGEAELRINNAGLYQFEYSATAPR